MSWYSIADTSKSNSWTSLSGWLIATVGIDRLEGTVEYIEESIQIANGAITAHQNNIKRLGDQDAEANAYAVALAQNGIRFVEDDLAIYTEDLQAGERQLDDVRKQRHDLIGRFVQPFLSYDQPAYELYQHLSADVLEALGLCMEVQENLEEERERRSAVEGRETLLRNRIIQLEDQMAIDNQLGEHDQSRLELAEKRMAMEDGAIKALIQHLNLIDRKVADLHDDRNVADANLCAALDEMLVGLGLMELQLQKPAADGKSDNLEHPPDLPEEAQELRAAKAQAWSNPKEATERFERIRETYRDDLDQFNVTKQPDDRQSEFDRCYLESRRQWTRNIIAAEKELEIAKVAMQAAGLVPSDTA